MSDIASLQLKIDSTQAKTAQRDLENLSAEGEKTEKSLVSMGTAIGIGITAASAATLMFVKSGIDAADSMNDLHLKTGLAFDELAAYDLLARQSGTDINGMAYGFKNLSKYMTEHNDKLSSIGVTSKDQSTAMGQFADIIAGIEDPALRTSLAMEVLGKSGVNLLPALMGGSAAFEEAKKNSEGYGKALEGAAGNADEFNDLMEIGTTKVNQFKTEVAGSLLPLLTEIAKGFTSASVASSSMDTAFNPLTETLRGLTIVAGNVAFVFKAIGTELGGMVAQVAALASGDFAGFGAIGDAMKKDAEESRKAFDEWEQNILNAGKLAKSEVNSAADATRKLSEEQEKAARKLVVTDKKDEKDKTFELNEKTIAQMKREADVYGYTAGQIKIYDSARAGANERQIEEIIILSQAMDKRKEDAELQEDIAKRNLEITKKYTEDIATLNKKSAEESEKAWTTFADQTQRVFGDVLYNGMVGKFQNIEEMFKEMILRMIANAAAAQAMMSMTSGMKGVMPSLLGAFTGGGQNYGSAGVSEADWLSGARADGGPVSGGSSYLVGERGPEIFTPSSSGNITANGAGGVNITDNTVINIDSRSDRMQVMKDVQKMIEAGHSKLVDNLQRKGQLA